MLIVQFEAFLYLHPYLWLKGFRGGSDGKASVCNAGDPRLIPGWGRSPGEGNGHLLQYSCLENSMDREPWWAIVNGVTKTRTLLSDFTFFHFRLKDLAMGSMHKGSNPGSNLMTDSNE